MMRMGRHHDTRSHDMPPHHDAHHGPPQRRHGPRRRAGPPNNATTSPQLAPPPVPAQGNAEPVPAQGSPGGSRATFCLPLARAADGELTGMRVELPGELPIACFRPHGAAQDQPGSRATFCLQGVWRCPFRTQPYRLGLRLPPHFRLCLACFCFRFRLRFRFPFSGSSTIKLIFFFLRFLSEKAIPPRSTQAAPQPRAGSAPARCNGKRAIFSYPGRSSSTFMTYP